VDFVRFGIFSVTYLNPPVSARILNLQGQKPWINAQFRGVAVMNDIQVNLLRSGGLTMLSTLQRLGVVASFSRPSVSDDNPFSESLFKTLKYHQSYPSRPFATINDARKWVTGFQYWYNDVHRHSSLKFITPNQRHEGQDVDILKNRKMIYEEAKSKRPERWTRSTRNWEAEDVVYLNPGKPAKVKEVKLNQVNE